MKEKENAQGVCQENTFKSIFYDHAERLRNFIYYKSGNLAVAEDLMQDAFEKLWENCQKVTLEKSKSYLYTVANRLFLNRVEHQKVVLKFESAGHTDRDNQNPHYLLEENEFKARLEAAINDLPETQRIVFLMNRIDKKKYKEIAAELDISVKAVEKRMHKALAALRQLHKKV